MSALAPSFSEYAFAIVALLWIGSVFMLVFALRGYFAARARKRDAYRAEVPESFVDAARESHATPAMHPTAMANGDVEASGHDGAGGLSLVGRGAGALAIEDQQPSSSSALAFASDEALIAAVSSRIAEDAEAARGLAELVRALYLDQSNFRFETIAALGAEDRRLALSLIEVWLANPTAIDLWQAMYAAVEKPARAVRADQHA